MQRPMILEQVETIGSTSAVLKRRGDDGAGECALMAVRQTAGTGRLGRGWASVPGNLHLSVLLRPRAPILPGHWSLLAAVALADCVEACGVTVRLKWPNDVLLADGKLAGILLETGGTPTWLVIGFGVNLVEAPPGLGRAVACLRDFVPLPAPEAFAQALIATLDRWRRRYDAEGFAPVLLAWRERGPAQGDPVTVGSSAGRLEGRFHGIGPQGGLLLEHEGAVRTVLSGEVE